MAYIGAGIILFNAKNEFLILKGKSGKWSFPKGVPDPEDKDDPLATAIRECKEEAGLTYEVDYVTTSATHVIYGDRHFFFGRLNEGAEKNLKIQESEISEYKWVDHSWCSTCWSELNHGIRQYSSRSRLYR